MPLKESLYSLFLLLLVRSDVTILAQCPAPLPCKCFGPKIGCHRLNLTDVVNFTWVNGQENFTSLDMSHNALTSVQPKAFYMLFVSSLMLSWNNITSIANGSFSGLQLTLRHLDLSHNMLHTLPLALGVLRNLAHLDVHDNPIDRPKHDDHHSHYQPDGFTDHVMYVLGNATTEFVFGHASELLHWPSTLQHLQRLLRLKVVGLKSGLLFHNSFHGFEQTLTSLILEYAYLRQLPEAVETLISLNELQLNYNRYTFTDDIFSADNFRALNKTLTTLHLKYDRLTRIPNGVQYLTRLANLSLEGNNLEFVTDEAIQSLQFTNLSTISFKNCMLKRIPSSIEMLTKLTDLDVSNNQIVTIETGDLQYMPDLFRLYLNGNPLRYISDDQFKGFYSLTYIDLSNTTLTVIPKAIDNLINLDTLDVQEVNIDCTCDLYWLKRWIDMYGLSLTLLGRCETIDQSLQRYVDYRVPNCPQYADP